MVAREGGLTKAAAKLHVSQPTISAQISALEGVLGEKLFRRTGRNLVIDKNIFRFNITMNNTSIIYMI
jgi:DNA-binding transcriptional LysR family regulator